MNPACQWIYYVQYYRFGFLFYNLRLTSYIINCSFTVSALLEIHFIVSLQVAWMNFILFFGQFDADWKIVMHCCVATVYTLSKMSSPNKPLYYNFCRHMKLGFASFRNFFFNVQDNFCSSVNKTFLYFMNQQYPPPDPPPPPRLRHGMKCLKSWNNLKLKNCNFMMFFIRAESVIL